MNILIINVDGNPQFIGGIKRVCVSLAQQWIQQGIRCYFVCIKDLGKKYDTIAGFPQIHLPEPIDTLAPVNKNFLLNFIKEKQIDILLNPFMDCREVTQLCFAVRKACIVKLICAWHFSPTHYTAIVDNSFFIRYKLGNPTKRYLQDFLLWIKWRIRDKKKVQQIWARYFEECIKSSDFVVLVSARTIPVVERMIGHYSNCLSAINNPNSFVETRILENKEKNVLWSGRLGYDAKHTEKMLSIWNRIFSKHKDWKLVVCGSGDADYFRRLCSKYHIENVEFPGFVNMEKYYAKASILCNTSVTEGWGLVLVEAMQYGCVPMAFDSYASVYDIIDDGENGYIIPAFDEKEYARKLDMLMCNEELRTKMAEKGRESTKQFEAGGIAQRWIELFQRL